MIITIGLAAINRLKNLALTFTTSLLLSLTARAAVTVTPEEMTQQHQWLRQNLLTATNLPPFSFIYQGQSSSTLLPSWGRKQTTKTLNQNRLQHTITWTHQHLQVKCLAIEHLDYPEIEWTVYLKNTGHTNTPIIENLQALDATLTRAATEAEFVLHGIKGDFCAPNSYEPFQHILKTNLTLNFAPANSGKSCDGPKGWPYYNLQKPGGGLILAIGWPGQWASSFQRDAADGLRVQAGQQLTHLFLQPGEEIRTPLIALLFWQGTDLVRAQNLWRRFYIAHVLPSVGGHPQGPVTQIQVGGSDPVSVQNFLDAGIHPDLGWRDAGAGGTTWYPSDVGPYAPGKDSWLNTGTWEVDPRIYPKGFKPFSDWLHQRQMKFVLWFEPERVGWPDSWLGKNHPDWLIPASTNTVGAIYNEGHPAALKWLIHHISDLIKSQGIDWYREDMNGGGPLPAWRNYDAPDRQGLTENLYVQGHLKFWDELKRLHPGLAIDSCASGGRRNDLETMRRAVPLLRSDFQFPDQKNVDEGNQGHTYGLSSWLPFQGTGAFELEPYSFRSFYIASFGMAMGLTPNNKAIQQQAYAECSKIAPSILWGDYYPLTPYSLSEENWIAWQFDRPETGEGSIQAFRRAKNQQPTLTLKLHGLDPLKTYSIQDFDKPEPATYTGQTLMQTGLPITLPPHGSAVLHYHQN